MRRGAGACVGAVTRRCCCWEGAPENPNQQSTQSWNRSPVHLPIHPINPINQSQRQRVAKAFLDMTQGYRQDSVR